MSICLTVSSSASVFATVFLQSGFPKCRYKHYRNMNESQSVLSNLGWSELNFVFQMNVYPTPMVYGEERAKIFCYTANKYWRGSGLIICSRGTTKNLPCLTENNEKTYPKGAPPRSLDIVLQNWGDENHSTKHQKPHELQQNSSFK